MTALKWLVRLTLIAGCVLVMKAAWIPAKAQLAYGLMDRAYAQVTDGGDAVAPWGWADFGVMAMLHVGGESVHVLDRASNQALAFGAGRHEEYDQKTGPLVLSGHRDTHFAVLEHMQVGDAFAYQTATNIQVFQIQETRIYDLREGVLHPPGAGEILLITCWPFDGIDPNTSKRFLVLGTQVNDRPQQHL